MNTFPEGLYDMEWRGLPWAMENCLEKVSDLEIYGERASFVSLKLAVAAKRKKTMKLCLGPLY